MQGNWIHPSQTKQIKPCFVRSGIVMLEPHVGVSVRWLQTFDHVYLIYVHISNIEKMILKAHNQIQLFENGFI